MASSSDRWRRIETLFYQALELKPEERSEFLAETCHGDADLQKELEALLDSAGKPLELLQKPVHDAAHQMMAAKRREMIGPGTQLAHYQVISLLGAGGMGE